MYYWNEDKIDDQGSDLEHVLLTLWKNATFCLANALEVNFPAEHGIPPSDLQIIMSEVWASIILYLFFFSVPDAFVYSFFLFRFVSVFLLSRDSFGLSSSLNITLYHVTKIFFFYDGDLL